MNVGDVEGGKVAGHDKEPEMKQRPKKQMLKQKERKQKQDQREQREVQPAQLAKQNQEEPATAERLREKTATG